MSANRSFDIAVAGAGAAGLAAALALARDGFNVAIVGRIDPRSDGRTIALLEGSVRFLDALGVWGGLRASAAPLRTLRIVDDTDSLFRPPPAVFEAEEIGLEAFGWNVEQTALVAALATAARSAPGLTVIEQRVQNVEFRQDFASLFLESPSTIQARLAIAADGRESPVRAKARIGTRAWRYPQSALTTILAHARPHGGASTEFHTRRGPFTLVPLPGDRSSLVWVTTPVEAERLADLDDAALALAVERQAHSMLGKMTIDGPRAAVPLSGLSVDRFHAERLALVGEAAHVFPPIGAQGLNLGLRDGAALRDAVVDARAAGEDIGGRAALRRYQASRDLDVRLRTAAVDGLNRSLLASLLPVDFLRGAGLVAVANIGPLRRAVMREGVMPLIGAPRLMRSPRPRRRARSETAAPVL